MSVQRAMHAIPLPLRTSFHHVRCMLLHTPSTHTSASLCCTLLSLEQCSNVGAGSAAAPETLHAGHTKQHIQDMLMLGVWLSGRESQGLVYLQAQPALLYPLLCMLGMLH